MTLPSAHASGAQLIEDFAPRAACLHLSPRRSVSAIRWLDSWLVTAADAVGDVEAVNAVLVDEESPAELVSADRRVDVAVFRLTARTSELARVGFGAAQVGTQLALIGRERGNLAAIWGTVRMSGEAWISQRGGRLDRRIELDVRLDAALEGAAVVAGDGSLLGMAVPGPAGKVLCIPAATIDRVVSAVAAHGRTPQPYLGVRLQPLWLDRATSAHLGLPAALGSVAVVMAVEPDSPASSCGLQPGDWLLGLDGRIVQSANEFVRSIGAKDPGDPTTINVHRAGAHQVLSARIGDRAPA